MESFSKTLSLLAAGLLVIAMMLAPAGFALAQDANDEDVSGQPVVVPDISGCWQGNAFNDSQGNDQITFFFSQNPNNKLSKQLSTLDLESAVSVHGPIGGKVKSDHFTFHGHVAVAGRANGCNIKGTGFFQNDGSLLGNYRYVGTCREHRFSGGEFSKVVFIGAACP